MNYNVRHRTTYEYTDQVSVSHHVLRLTPRDFPGQLCLTTKIAIEPAPAAVHVHHDYFGNEVSVFTLQEAHGQLVVDARSELEVVAREPVDY